MADIENLAGQGESETLEFKRSTGELREAMQTLCAFANGSGGIVLIGVRSDGKIVGQQVTEQTLHDIAAARDRFEPPIDVAIERIEVASGRAVLVLIVAGTSDAVPCAYDGRAFARVGNTTRRMCRATGIAPPEFAEISGAVVVVFRADVLASAGAYPQVAPQVAAILKAAATPSSAVELQRAAGLKDRVHFLREYLQPLLGKGWLERTIPDKPRSRNQGYRTTEPGRKAAYGLGSEKEGEP